MPAIQNASGPVKFVRCYPAGNTEQLVDHAGFFIHDHDLSIYFNKLRRLFTYVLTSQSIGCIRFKRQQDHFVLIGLVNLDARIFICYAKIPWLPDNDLYNSCIVEDGFVVPETFWS